MRNITFPNTPMVCLQTTAWAIALGVSLIAAPVYALSEETVPLADFGQGGSRLPAIAEHFVSDDFYTADMVGPLASRQYYTAYFEVPREIERPGKDLVRGAVGQFEIYQLEDPRLILELENHTEDINDIVLSVHTAAGDVRNSLIRVGVGESLRLRTGSLAGARSIALLSFQDFGARVQIFDQQQPLNQRSLEVMAPRETHTESSNKLRNYCQNVSETIRVTADSTGGYVVAKGVRTKSLFHTGLYYLEIEYPVGTVFHKKFSVTRNIYSPACEMDSYETKRASDTSISHKWVGMDDLLLFCAAPASAECLTGCNETFTIVLTGLSLHKCF